MVSRQYGRQRAGLYAGVAIEKRLPVKSPFRNKIIN